MKKEVVLKPLSNEEYRKVLGKDDLVDSILYTGVRIAELAAILKEWNKESNYIDILTKKSGNVTNRIELIPIAKETLLRLIDSGVGLYHKRTLQRHIEKVSKELNIPFSAHNLRATFATQLVQNGVNIIIVQTLMNHTELTTTSRYIKFNENMKRTALETLVSGNWSPEGKTIAECHEYIIVQRANANRMALECMRLRDRIKELEDKESNEEFNKRLDKEIDNKKTA